MNHLSEPGRPPRRRVLTNRFRRGVTEPSSSPKGAPIGERLGALKARMISPSRLPPAKTNPSMTRSRPMAWMISAGPRRLLDMKTTLGEQFAASVASRSETWLRRTTTRM